MKCMHVLWLTGRSTADLCSTTQRSLIEGILEHRVSFVNGDDTVPLNHIGFTHVPLSSKAPRGVPSQSHPEGHRRVADGSNHRPRFNGGVGRVALLSTSFLSSWTEASRGP